MLFTARCYACEEKTKALLCPACLSHLTLLLPQGRCLRCFGPLTPHECNRAGLARQAFCFERSPVSLALHKKELSKLLVSYLLIQLNQLAWEFDYITAIPLHPLRRLGSTLQDKWLERPLAKSLSMSSRSFLTSLDDDNFALRRMVSFEGETILIVGFSPHPNMQQIVHLLQDAGAYHILGLYITP